MSFDPTELLPVITAPAGGSLPSQIAAPHVALPELTAHALRVTSTTEDFGHLLARLLANQTVAFAEHQALRAKARTHHPSTWEADDKENGVAAWGALVSLRRVAHPPKAPAPLTEEQRAAIDADARDAIRGEARAAAAQPDVPDVGATDEEAA
jgi:hypothetical protein